jgi:hypothetical protein
VKRKLGIVGADEDLVPVKVSVIADFVLMIAEEKTGSRWADCSHPRRYNYCRIANDYACGTSEDLERQSKCPLRKEVVGQTRGQCGLGRSNSGLYFSYPTLIRAGRVLWLI